MKFRRSKLIKANFSKKPAKQFLVYMAGKLKSILCNKIQILFSRHVEHLEHDSTLGLQGYLAVARF